MRLALLLVCLVSLSSASETRFTGRVVAISDGDTLIVTSGSKLWKLRLQGIDAPDENQAFADRAKQELANLVLDRDVQVDVVGKDRRNLSHVSLAGASINLELVRRGCAWWDRKQAPNDAALAAAEAEARAARRGLWAGRAPVPPWEFRRSKSKG